ncbi:hypothetical protein F4825DRAFT_473846 [Nemania diffusa]|nr:hypothetical protein F4825DRAFT_473846 [Nemania diffusa]
MQLFRRYFGARNAVTTTVSFTSEDKTDNIEKVNSNPPPSYEDSQDASLRVVLQGAQVVMPLLWPSASPPSSAITSSLSPSALADECQRLAPDIESRTSEKKEKTENTCTSPSPGVEETPIMEVLVNLAMTACGDRPFLDRVRQFSDFYFTPYMASEGLVSSQGDEPSSPSRQETQPATPLQEQQRIALQNLDAPRESAALVLCARVLEEYYAGLGHADSPEDTNLAHNPSGLSTAPPRARTSTADAKQYRSTPPTPHPRLKTRLAQIAACAEAGCACGDYDDATTQRPAPQDLPSAAAAAHHRCSCGHPRPSHGASPAGVARLLRRYTNWHDAPYAALRHRGPSGRAKRRVHEIEVCRGAPPGAAAADCACRDYDKGWRTARCARCGHYYRDHVPIGTAAAAAAAAAVAQESQAPGSRWKKKGGAGGSRAGGPDPRQRSAEWELSWILVENAYLLLSQIIPPLRDDSSLVSSP